ncbi:MAG: hypothetical protein LBN30_06245 [Oscillospiraceae bacterium]|jgi:hypothetical protein|nr:hypothetical protein [Oscillospiraceae bacterium]
MKKSIKRLAAAVLSVILALTVCSGAALAAGTELTGSGAEQTFAPWGGTAVKTYKYGTDQTITDLFGDATKNLAPGDTASTTVTLTNNATEAVTFYLRATPIRKEKAVNLTEPKSTDGDGSDFQDKTANDDLLDLVTIVIVSNEASPRTLYNGRLNGLDSTFYGPPNTTNESPIPIGTVSSGSSASITATITIPESLGNTYQDTLTAFEWVFYAWIPDPVDSPTPPDYPGDPSPAVSPAVSVEPTPEPTEFTEPTIPLGLMTPEPTQPPVVDYPTPPTPPVIDLEEDEIPKPEWVVVNPKTGDNGFDTWTVLMGTTLTVLVVWLVVAIAKKRKEVRD